MSQTDTKKRATSVLRALKRTYPDAECSLNYRTPLQLLVATILSAQCTDARVNMVTKDLFKRYKTAKDFANANPEELSEMIRSTGFFRNKTKSIIGMGQALVEHHGGKVPQTLSETGQSTRGRTEDGKRGSWQRLWD